MAVDPQFLFDWEADGDRFSFEDSERFEEDSLCSWISEPESLCNNWRGWKRLNGSGNQPLSLTSNAWATAVVIKERGLCEEGEVPSLVELAARDAAHHIPFEVVEHFYPPVPEQLQLRIAYWSFPENEEDIRLYSCLANGSADEFQKGEHLYKNRAVKDALQIGFHLSSTVVSFTAPKTTLNVAVVFDRKRITSCNCTCNSSASWCSHVVALCLFRIHQPNNVLLRAPVSESLSRLHRDQLQKFAQYLISELPQQILPTAQRLLDELLSSQATAINTVCGAPDPTAGASIAEQTSWCLDEATLHENIKKTLIKFCVPSPIVFSDVNYLSSSAPPAASEWSSLLRPLRGREPEGMWNLLSIVRELYRRNDGNAMPLLEILTEECMACEQILVWWFVTKVSICHGGTGLGSRGQNNSTSGSSQHACSSLCDEIVSLWRLATLNPANSPLQREELSKQFKDWHLKTLDKVCKARSNNNQTVKKSDIEIFPGFKPAMEAALLDWNDYPISGVTYNQMSAHRLALNLHHHAQVTDIAPCQFTYLASKASVGRRSPCVYSRSRSPKHSADSLTCADKRLHVNRVLNGQLKSQRSSSSSEGFCENDNDAGVALPSYGSLLVRHGSDSSLNEIETPDVGLAERLRPLPNICMRKRSNSAGPSSFGFNNGASKDAESEGAAGGCLRRRVRNKSGSERSRERVQDANFAGFVTNDESQPSSDEYQVYNYDPRGKTSAPFSEKNKDKKEDDRANIFANIRKMDDKMEILFARAEALHGHGHSREAVKLAVQLAEEMLTNPPDLLGQVPATPTKGKKKKNQGAMLKISTQASNTLSKAAFLCTVLLEDIQHFHLAFKIGLFGLELPRPPASSKILEIKLLNQESELVSLLKRIPMSHAELSEIRERARQLRDGALKSRGDALLPLMLTSFIFDALSLPPVGNGRGNGSSYAGYRAAGDEQLGFEAAVVALGLKANVSEADHPLLCEGTRRQRGELAVALLVHYKDDQEKITKVMDKLLDKDIHQMYKGPLQNSYYSAGQTVGCALIGQQATSSSSNLVAAPPVSLASISAPSTSSLVNLVPTSSESEKANSSGEFANLQQEMGTLSLSDGPLPTTSRHAHRSDVCRSPSWDDGEDYKAWEAKFRCTNLKTNRKHSQGMAAIDSSAPETTSSDNSPTLVRRIWPKHMGPGSDSGSSGTSSDSLGSSSSGEAALARKARENESVLASGMRLPTTAAVPSEMFINRPTGMTTKGMRFKGKKASPTIPNQPSEASAHFMFELAKTVLGKAGGNSSTSLFTQPSTSQTHNGPHRALHMCAFQIGLYALGLHNCVSPNWLSRTYSSHVSWITGQAVEIGSVAINFLIETWEGHLTPPEVATLADRASRGRDPATIRAAAELALSCLPHAHALNPNEIQRALMQCKEQNNEMLERACLAVESAAKGGGVYPEILFDVARKWFEMYEENRQGGSHDTQSPVIDNVPMEIATVGLDGMNYQGQDGPVVSAAQLNLATIPHIQCQPVPVSVSYIPTSGLTPIPYPPTYPYMPQNPQFQQFQQPHLPVQQFLHYPLNAQVFGSLNTLTNFQCAPPQIYAGLRPAFSLNPTASAPPNGIHAATIGTISPAAVPTVPPNVRIQHIVVSAAQQQPGVQAGGPAPVAQPSSPSQASQRQYHYLLSTYRVGMLAMETLIRRVHDDRPQAKYSRNPPYGDDVKWLLSIAIKLGTTYLQQFCLSAVNAIASPFILHEIAVDIAHVLARNNLSQVANHLRSPMLSPIVQKCLQMFIQCCHQKMYHITPADYEEFVMCMRCARQAFNLTPGGMAQFNDLLQSLRRSKSYKKELWQRIMTGLNTGHNPGATSI